MHFVSQPTSDSIFETLFLEGISCDSSTARCVLIDNIPEVFCPNEQKKAERQRDALEEELTYQLNRLDGYVGSEDQTSKIKKAMADVEIVMEKLTKTIGQLAVDASEGHTNADKERMEKVQEKRDKAVDTA